MVLGPAKTCQGIFIIIHVSEFYSKKGNTLLQHSMKQ